MSALSLLPSAAVVALGIGLAPAVEIIAHRGASADAPENTIAAFELAWQQGADAVEADFWLCADGDIVCLHDADTKKTAGVSHAVADSSLSDLRALDVGRWMHERWAGQRIPTLEEFVATLPDDGARTLVIEIKDGPRLVPVLADLLEKMETPLERVRVISFQPAVLSAVAEHLPTVPTAWLVGAKDLAKQGAAATVETARKVGAEGISVQATPEIPAALVAAASEAGLSLHAWTIDDPALAQRYADAGFSSITTNRPAVMQDHFRPRLPDAPRPPESRSLPLVE